MCYIHLFVFLIANGGKRTTMMRLVSGKHDMWSDLRRTGYYLIILQLGESRAQIGGQGRPFVQKSQRKLGENTFL